MLLAEMLMNIYIGKNAQNLKKLAPHISTSTLSLKELLLELKTSLQMFLNEKVA